MRGAVGEGTAVSPLPGLRVVEAHKNGMFFGRARKLFVLEGCKFKAFAQGIFQV